MSDDLRQENQRLLLEVNRLRALINSPHTADFLEAVRIEAAHQVERWGIEHDAGKRPEDWIALAVYLVGKATKAHYDGDRTKLLHHVITVAAVCANWHAAETGADNRMRPGVGQLVEAPSREEAVSELPMTLHEARSIISVAGVVRKDEFNRMTRQQRDQWIEIVRAAERRVHGWPRESSTVELTSATRECTCLGSCKGAAGLAAGWQCALRRQG